ncbi:MAG: RsmE family RNA methyltransferase [bacterium]
MHRFYCNISKQNGVLDDEESYHAIKVLRLNLGEKVVCFDGLGHEWLCEIVSLRAEGSSSKHPNIKLNIVSEKYFPSKEELKKPKVCIIVSLYKFDRFEFGLEKLVELGVDEIIVTKTHLSQFDLPLAEKKLARWQEIVVSACKQSERKWNPNISILDMKKILGTTKDESVLNLVATTELDNPIPLKDIEANKYNKIVIFIGPEGGFEKNELDEIVSAGFKPVSLGGNVLRAETAAIYAAVLCSNY